MPTAIHPIPRPKILTRFNLSTNKTLRIYVSDASQYDKTVDAVIPSGDYYVSGDGQSDDLLFQINEQVNTEISSTHSLSNYEFTAYIDPETHKVSFSFWGSKYSGPDPYTPDDVKLAWTEQDSAEIGSILGFDTIADDTKTTESYPKFTAEDQHAYGWYADEDGYVAEDLPYDSMIPDFRQSVAVDGTPKSLSLGSRFRNFMALQQMTHAKTWSNGTDYESAPPWPLTTNVALECWFREAAKGTPFRVYRNGFISTSRNIDRGVADSSSSTTQLDDSAKSWDVDQYNGMAVYIEDFYTVNNSGTPGYWYISDTGATSLTIPSAVTGVSTEFDSKTYYVLDHKYGTYVLDGSKMKDRGFLPPEPNPNDRYDFRIPLLKFS